MDWSAWGGSIAALMAFFVAVGWIVKLTLALSRAESTAEAAAKEATAAAVLAASLRGIMEISESKMRESVDKVERELVEHRVSVAREYVSNQMLANFEKKLIDAIDRIGSRLDSLFVPRVSPPPAAG